MDKWSFSGSGFLAISMLPVGCQCLATGDFLMMILEWELGGISHLNFYGLWDRGLATVLLCWSVEWWVFV